MFKIEATKDNSQLCIEPDKFIIEIGTDDIEISFNREMAIQLLTAIDMFLQQDNEIVSCSLCDELNNFIEKAIINGEDKK